MLNTEVVRKFMEAAGQELPDGPMMTETARLHFEKLLPEGFVGLELAFSKKDDAGVLAHSLELIWTLIAGLNALGFPLEAGWNEVARANLAKINEDGIVHKRADGRVRDPENWTPPDLRHVLDQHGYHALIRKTGVCIRSADPEE